MSDNGKLRYGTRPWYEMVGEVMCRAAKDAALSEEINFTLVEYFFDGDEWSGGLFEGYRFDITRGMPSFRLGAGPDEQGDLTLRATRRASQAMHKMHANHPDFGLKLGELLASGEFKIVNGSVEELLALLGPVHDRIVDRTVQDF